MRLKWPMDIDHELKGDLRFLKTLKLKVWKDDDILSESYRAESLF